jgi:hypothetical protein
MSQSPSAPIGWVGEQTVLDFQIPVETDCRGATPDLSIDFQIFAQDNRPLNAVRSSWRRILEASVVDVQLTFVTNVAGQVHASVRVDPGYAQASMDTLVGVANQSQTHLAISKQVAKECRQYAPLSEGGWYCLARDGIIALPHGTQLGISATEVFSSGRWLWARRGDQLSRYEERFPGVLVATTKTPLKTNDTVTVVPLSSGQAAILDENVLTIVSAAGEWSVDARISLTHSLRMRAAYVRPGRIWVVGDGTSPIQVVVCVGATAPGSVLDCTQQQVAFAGSDGQGWWGSDGSRVMWHFSYESNTEQRSVLAPDGLEWTVLADSDAPVLTLETDAEPRSLPLVLTADGIPTVERVDQAGTWILANRPVGVAARTDAGGVLLWSY